MKNYEEKLGEAIRIEYSEKDGKLFLVFEITNPKYKETIKKTWTKDIEFKLIERALVIDNE